MSKTISVIVPVYKTEKYVEQCIKSIVSQTYDDLEILLVDDGSPDKAGDICDKWCKKDKRIKVIHKVNEGGGAARNAALRIAQGQYIAFVDSDDYIDIHMFEILIKHMSDDIDIVECDYITTGDNEGRFRIGENTHLYSCKEALEENINDHFFRQLIWNKLYKRKITENIFFPEQKGIDDEFWTYKVIANANKLIRIDSQLYAYRQQEDSVMHSISLDKRIRALEAKKERHKLICGRMPDLEGVSMRSLWYSALYIGQRSCLDENKTDQKDIIQKVQSILNEFTPRLKEMGKLSLKDKFWMVMASHCFVMTCKLRNLLRIGL